MDENILPIGSVVKVESSSHLFMITGRGYLVKVDGKDTYFDYSVCLYPEGVVGDKNLFLNETDISEVLFKGYIDSNEIDYKKIIVKAWNKKMERELNGK